jgi:hypothetical protein
VKDRLPDEVDSYLVAAAPEMYALLKEIQWNRSPDGYDITDLCPVCQHLDENGHAEDCRLAAVLKAVEGET